MSDLLLATEMIQQVMTEEEDESQKISIDEFSSTQELTPVIKCCLKKKCYERVEPKIQNELFNRFWQIGDYAKQNYFLVGLMAAESPKQVTSRPIKKNKSLSWKYWVDIRGRKEQVCKCFFLAVYGISDKRLRVLQTKLVNGDPLEDQRGRYDTSRRANQHTARRAKQEDTQLIGVIEEPISDLSQKIKRHSEDINDIQSTLITVSEIIIPPNFSDLLATNCDNNSNNSNNNSNNN
ncbi:uncharacterized protein LOC128952287 [Oppia nitens]|uniref:uncharacterized protein LOC128952287 n=1 Tax=Oppia nitens TaxID=1686743 RepID=UPI0023D9BE20|nr:uncharacterized protein LOC128952287 [Oppia nitens]